ncbi:MAG: sulfurtransferase TusA family protein [Methanoregula sp.]|nr:sulfurtransferase TusA family protein [Methanoregula sp.]
MTTKTLDISGKVCPYCLLAVQKAAAALNTSDVLVITCDHPPAATTTIPQFAQDTGMGIESKKISPGLWEVRLTKK